MTKATKTQNRSICLCGCGKATKGGSFRQGHDQRLRGILKRNEALSPVTRAFISRQPKTSEWRKLASEGVKLAAEARERAAAKAKAKAKKAAAKAAPRRVRKQVQAEAAAPQPTQA